jgi:sugar phosphate permease
MGPLTQEFGWGRAQLSSGQAISAILPLFLVTVVGVVVDKWGTRRVVLPGLVATAAAIAAFSLLNGSFAEWIGFWVLFGACSLLVQAAVWSTAVESVFKAAEASRQASRFRVRRSHK